MTWRDSITLPRIRSPAGGLLVGEVSDESDRTNVLLDMIPSGIAHATTLGGKGNLVFLHLTVWIY